MTDPILECSGEVEKLAADNGIKDLAMNVTSVLVYRGDKRGTEPDSFEVSGSYDPSNAGGKSTFESKVQEILGAKSINAEVELEIKLKGTKFPTLAQLTPVSKDDTNKTPVDVAPRPGEATLFDFWATWCGPCQGPMKHNQEMLEKHPEWAGKVRIVGVSIDDKIDAPIARVTEKGWTKIEQYWCPGGWGSTVCKTFGIHGIPFCALVDGTGTIQMTGHPMSMNLEVNLSKFAAEGHFEGEGSGDAQGGAKPKTPDYTFEKCTAELDELYKSHPTVMKAIPEMLIAAVFKKQPKGGKYELGEGFVLLRCTWSKKNKSAFEALKELINTTFASKVNIKLQDREIPMGTLEFGGMCSKCNKSLTGCDQYRCAICQPAAFFCTACVEEKKNPTAITDLVHPHGLYYLQKDSGPKLDEIAICDLKMGSGKIEDKRHGSCGCDFRGLHPEGQSPCPIGIRWKCANCPTVDVCDLCFNIARNPADPAHAALIQKRTETGHDFKTHVYIRQEFVDFLSLPY
jgi:thiol-disulfide isomerase/thioredoxin